MAQPRANLPPDRLVAGATADGAATVCAVNLTRGVETARSAHETLPVATAALGRTMAGALLLAQGLKAPERLTLRILGNGPLGALVADASPTGEVRAYVQNPRVMLPPNDRGKLDVGRGVGHEGLVHVSHDTGLRYPYTGSVPIVSGEIGEDIAHYLATSLQVNAAVAVGVRVGTGGVVLGAGGILVQRLPDGDLATIDRLERALSDLGPVSSAIAAGADARQLVEAVVAQAGHGELTELDAMFRCTCNRERTAQVMASLGNEALDEMIEDGDGAEVRCQFCGAVYRFDADELRAMRSPV